MTYASGGVIQSVDINGFIGGSTANVSGQLNTLYSTGNGNAGYGQGTIANVSSGGAVITQGWPPDQVGPPSQIQWREVIYRLNIIRQHQTGSTSGITVPIDGNIIQFYSTLSTQLTNAYNSRMTAFANGTTVTGTNNTWNPTATATSSMDVQRDVLVSFSSADSARYFFNAGGKLNIIISAVDNAGTARSQSVRDLINNIGGVTNFSTYTNSGRSGTGGSISINDTNIGYYNNSGLTGLVKADDAAPYSGYYAILYGGRYDSVFTNGANGSIVNFRTRIVASADDTLGGAINVTVTTRVDIIPPSTLYLSDTWGTPTITYI